jgi:hypothetical protein
MAAYRWLLAPSFPSTGKGRDRGARELIKPFTPTFVLSRQRLCRNVILRSGATKNLLFSFGTQRRFDKSTEEKQILRYRSG